MDRNNKYYGIIEELVKNHRKFPGYEAILDDIIADVYAHSEVILKTITDENVIKAYFEKVIATSVITVPKKLGYSKPDIKNTISVEPVINNVVKNSSAIEASSEDTNINGISNAARVEYVDKMINSVSVDLDYQSSATDKILTEEQKLVSYDVVENTAKEETIDNENNLSIATEETNTETNIISEEDIVEEDADNVTNLDLNDSENLNFTDTQFKDTETEDNYLFDDIDAISEENSFLENEIEETVNENKTDIESKDLEEQSFVIVQPLENEEDNQATETIDAVLDEDALIDEEIEIDVNKNENENDIGFNVSEEQTFDDVQPLDIEEVSDAQNTIADNDLIEEPAIENSNFEEDNQTDEILELNYSEGSDDLQESISEEAESDEIEETDFENTFDSIEEQAVDFNADLTDINDQIDIQENFEEEDFLLQQDDNVSVDSDFILNESNLAEDLLENVDNNDDDINELGTMQESSLEETEDFSQEFMHENNSDDLQETKQDNNLSIVNFDAFSYTPVREKYSDNDKQDLIKDLTELNNKYPELNIFAVYDAKYNKNKDISTISEELSMSPEVVVKALNEIVDLV